VLGVVVSRHWMIFRAINVQLAHRDECARLAVVIVAALPGLDV
jgi:hypothetical protein